MHERLYWLRRACGEKGQTHWTGRFQKAVSALRRRLRAGILAKVDAVGSAAENIREALGLESEEENSAISSGKKGVGRRKAVGKAALPGLAAVAVPLGEVTVKVRLRERPFEIEATAEAVDAVIKFCKSCLEDGVLRRETLRRDDKKPDAFAFAASDCPAVTGCVTWHPSVGAWCVHYKGGLGQRQIKRVSVRGAAAPRSFAEAASGEEGSKGAWASARKRAYCEAIRLWNDLDKSSRPRLEVPGLEEQASETVLRP